MKLHSRQNTDRFHAHIQAALRELDDLRAILDARQTELLEANNREVERRREAERERDELRALVEAYIIASPGDAIVSPILGKYLDAKRKAILDASTLG